MQNLRINVFKLGSTTTQNKLDVKSFDSRFDALAMLCNTKPIYNPGEDFYYKADNVLNVIVFNSDDIETTVDGDGDVQYNTIGFINQELSKLHPNHNFDTVTQSNFIFMRVGEVNSSIEDDIQTAMSGRTFTPAIHLVRGYFAKGQFELPDGLIMAEILDNLQNGTITPTPNVEKVKAEHEEPDLGEVNFNLEPDLGEVNFNLETDSSSEEEKEPDQPSPCAGLCGILSKMNRGMKMNFIIYGTTCAAGAVTALALGLGLYSDALTEKLDPNLNVLTEALEKHGAERWAIVVIAAIVVTVITMIAMLCCISDKEAARELK